MLTQDILKTLLDYDPESGVFRWKKSTSDKIRIGDIAGCFSRGYRVIRINKRLYRAHRLAFLWMTGSFPDDEVDHINGIRSDNKWTNIRGVNSVENRRNTALPRDNSSGAMGVFWDKYRKKWVARIGINGKPIHLGRYNNWEDAVKARKSAEKKYGFHPNHGRVINNGAAY